MTTTARRKRIGLDLAKARLSAIFKLLEDEEFEIPHHVLAFVIRLIGVDDADAQGEVAGDEESDTGRDKDRAKNSAYNRAAWGNQGGC